VSILIIIALLVIVLGAFNAAAVAWVQDSRDQISDDHRR
jgi:hypothetical protein